VVAGVITPKTVENTWLVTGLNTGCNN